MNPLALIPLALVAVVILCALLGIVVGFICRIPVRKETDDEGQP